MRIPNPDEKRKSVKYTAPGDGELWRSLAAALLMPGLSELERQVAGILMLYADTGTGKCCPGEATIAEITGKSERQVRRVIRELEKRGLIKAQPRYDKGHRTSNGYDIKWKVATQAFAGVKAKIKAASKPDISPDISASKPDISASKPDISRPSNRTSAMSGNRAESDRAENRSGVSANDKEKSQPTSGQQAGRIIVQWARLSPFPPDGDENLIVFVGKVFGAITMKQLTAWVQRYPNINGLIDEIEKADNWYAGKGFQPGIAKLDQWLAKENDNSDFTPAIGAVRLWHGGYWSRW